MSRVIIISGIIGVTFWVIFNALNITWLGYLLAAIIIGSVGWSLKEPSINIIHYLMDVFVIICYLSFWFVLMYSFEIEWAKALFLTSLFLLAIALFNPFDIGFKEV